MALHVLHHDDGVVHHQTDGEDDGQQGEEVDGEAEGLHQEDPADQRYRDCHHRDQHRPEGAEEEKDDDHDDQKGVAEGLQHLMDGAGDVFGGVIGDVRLEAGGEVAFDGGHLDPNLFYDVQGVGVGEGPYPYEYRGLAGKADLGVVVLGPQHHVGDLAQPDDGPVLFPYHQLPEFIHSGEVGVGGQVDLDVGPLAPS